MAEAIVDKHGQPTPFLSLTWREAEARFGRRLDRRRRYGVYEGDELELLTVSRWTQYCTGCTEVPEMGVAPEVGIGCHECGHTGKRRFEMWAPHPVFTPMVGAARKKDRRQA